MKPVRDTKARILDTAEQLFAERGLDAVSIRDITEGAGANLAAVHYHFGSKEELIAAVLERRITPLNKARLAALDEVERSARGKPAPVESILGAFIRPTLACCLDARQGGAAFAKLFGRCLSEPKPEVEAFLKKQFEPLVERLDGALMRALPSLPRAEIYWRMKFTFGALHHWLLTKDKFVPSWAEGTDAEAQTRKLIAFATAGFRAPLPVVPV